MICCLFKGVVVASLCFAPVHTVSKRHDGINDCCITVLEIKMSSHVVFKTTTASPLSAGLMLMSLLLLSSLKAYMSLLLGLGNVLGVDVTSSLFTTFILISKTFSLPVVGVDVLGLRRKLGRETLLRLLFRHCRCCWDYCHGHCFCQCYGYCFIGQILVVAGGRKICGSLS